MFFYQNGYQILAAFARNFSFGK